MTRAYFVYILSNRWRTIYVGVTNDITRRVLQHRTGAVGFTSRYSIDRLIYVETTSDVRAAIEREKQIKRWTRKKKIALIESTNPGWSDLAHDWFDDAKALPYVAVEGDCPERRCHPERSEGSLASVQKPLDSDSKDPSLRSG